MYISVKPKCYLAPTSHVVRQARKIKLKERSQKFIVNNVKCKSGIGYSESESESVASESDEKTRSG